MNMTHIQEFALKILFQLNVILNIADEYWKKLLLWPIRNELLKKAVQKKFTFKMKNNFDVIVW